MHFQQELLTKRNWETTKIIFDSANTKKLMSVAGTWRKKYQALSKKHCIMSGENTQAPKPSPKPSSHRISRDATIGRETKLDAIILFAMKF